MTQAHNTIRPHPVQWKSGCDSAVSKMSRGREKRVIPAGVIFWIEVVAAPPRVSPSSALAATRLCDNPACHDVAPGSDPGHLLARTDIRQNA